MMMVIVAIRDDKAECFTGRPFVAHSLPAAQRMFQDGLELEDSPMRKHPHDFSLWCLGQWNQETGVITAQMGGKVHVCSAVDFGIGLPKVVEG